MVNPTGDTHERKHRVDNGRIKKYHFRVLSCLDTTPGIRNQQWFEDGMWKNSQLG